jgi:hypothetical protein
MQIIIDEWYEFVILALTILGSLFIVYLIIKLIISSNKKIKGYGLEIGGTMECTTYVQEHSKSLVEIKEQLLLMESERKLAREENSLANKTIQIEIKLIASALDGMLEAFQINKIGNGNLEKARKSLSKCYDTQDEYLINQL